MKRAVPLALFLLTMLLLTACAAETPATAVTPVVGLPNPVSQNCTAVGGTLQI
jgi:putative hemolysin